MRRAMAAAEVGDDVLDGDPSVRELEREAARWLGKQDCLFVPSGTMANQVAIGAWMRPGEELIVEREAHVLRWEAGAAAANHGVQFVALPGRRGALDPEHVRRAIRPGNIHSPVTALVCVEQTHMGAGGTVVGLENLEAIAAIGRERSIPVHLDGARLANAVVASGIAAERWGACADSVSLCFSKGLGAPVGSVIAADDGAFLERARVVRKRLGGWMRQSGIIAAGALYALRNNLERLAEDHALARELARSLQELPGLACDGAIETNLVMIEVDERAGFDAPGLAAELARRGIGVSNLERTTLRCVTHMGVGPQDVRRLRGALAEIMG
jgi:threonine aldolase